MDNSSHQIAATTSTNKSNSSTNMASREEWISAVQYTFFTAIFLLSVVGNSLVCLVIIRTPRMRTTRNFLLVNLAVADLTVALLCIPFETTLKLSFPKWPLGPAMCKILWPTMTSVTTCSSATLTAISYDRYRAVVHPWKPRFTLRQTAFIIIAVWLVSFVLVIPFMLVLRIKHGYCNEVWPNTSARQAYTLSLFIIQFIVPLFFIMVAYTRVVLKLRYQAAKFARKNVAQEIQSVGRGTSSILLTPEVSEAPPSATATSLPDKRLVKLVEPTQMLCAPSPSIGAHKEIKHLKRNTKIVKMLLTVVTLYAICLLPNQVVWLWYEFGSGQKSPYIKELMTLGSLMIYLNSSVNPLLYAGMNDEFRRGFVGLLCCQWKCGRLKV